MKTIILLIAFCSSFVTGGAQEKPFYVLMDLKRTVYSVHKISGELSLDHPYVHSYLFAGSRTLAPASVTELRRYTIKNVSDTFCVISFKPIRIVRGVYYYLCKRFPSGISEEVSGKDLLDLYTSTEGNCSILFRVTK